MNTSPAFSYKNGEDGFIFLNNKALDYYGLEKNAVLSHEKNHFLRNPEVPTTKDIEEFNEIFDFSKLKPSVQNYFYNKNHNAPFTELEARGSQLLNYFNGEPLTELRLKYAATHYPFDNNMTQMFSGIRDWGKAAEWFNKRSLKNGGKLI